MLGDMVSNCKRATSRGRCAHRGSLTPDRLATETVGMRERPNIAEEPRGAGTINNDQFVGRRIVCYRGSASRCRKFSTRGELCPCGRASCPVGIVEHPCVVEGTTATIRAAEDNHTVVCGIIHCTIRHSCGRRTASGAELCPGWGATSQTIGIAKHPRIVVATTTAVIASEDNQAIGCRIVDG